MGGMPAWAMVLGAPYAADKLIVDPIQSAYGLYKGIRDDQSAQNDKEQAKADLAAFAKDPTYQPDYSKYSDPATAAKYGEEFKQQRQFRLEQAAAPTVDKLQSFKAEGWGSDPSFSGQEWAQGLIDTMGVKTNPANPYERKALNDFALNAQNEADLTRTAANVFGGSTPNPADLSRFLVQGGDKATNQVKSLQDLAKLNSEERIMRGRQQWINAAGNSPNVVADPNMRTLAASAPYGATIEDLSKFASTTGVIPDVQVIESGIAGEPTQKTNVLLDKRKGTAANIPGVLPTTDPGKNIIINNNLPAQETAFSKGVGEANAKQYADAVAGKQGAEKALQTSANLRQALNNTWSGKLAKVRYEVAKYTPGQGNDPYVVNYEIATNLSKGMALDLLQNFKGQISDGERKFVTDMATNPTMERASQDQLLNIYDRVQQGVIDRADKLIPSVESAPVRSNINRTLNEKKPAPQSIAAAPKTATPQRTRPRTADDYVNQKFRGR